VAEEHAHVEAFFVARRDRVHATNDFARKSLALLPWLIRVLCVPREVLVDFDVQTLARWLVVVPQLVLGTQVKEDHQRRRPCSELLISCWDGPVRFPEANRLLERKMYRKPGDAVGAMEHLDGQDAQDSFARGNVARVDVVLYLVDFCVDGVPRSIMTLVNVRVHLHLLDGRRRCK